MSEDRTRRERDALFKLHQINRAMSVEHDMGKLLNLIMDNSIALTRAERGFLIMRTVDGRYDVRVARNIGKEAIDHPMFKVSRGIIDECWSSSTPIVLDDAQNDTQFRGRGSVANLQLASVACVPLRRGADVIGVLYLDNRFRKELFEPSDMLILETFADAGSAAVVNAQLICEIAEKNKDLELLNLKLKEQNVNLDEEVKKKDTEIESLETKLRIKPPKW